MGRIKDFLLGRQADLEDEGSMSAEEVKQHLESLAIKQVCDGIDLINSAIPHLPRGWKPWMIWRPYPHLVLRRYDFDNAEILYGDGSPLPFDTELA
jgi:hypothetical protein